MGTNSGTASRLPLAFDVDAAVDLGNPNAHWITDTERRRQSLQFDNIDCGEP